MALIHTISFHTSGHIKPFEHLFQAHKINRFKPGSHFKAHSQFLYEFPLWCVQGGGAERKCYEVGALGGIAHLGYQGFFQFLVLTDDVIASIQGTYYPEFLA